MKFTPFLIAAAALLWCATLLPASAEDAKAADPAPAATTATTPATPPAGDATLSGNPPEAEMTAEEKAERDARKAVDDYIKTTGAKLWIQHDLDQFVTLKKAPEFYE